MRGRSAEYSHANHYEAGSSSGAGRSSVAPLPPPEKEDLQRADIQPADFVLEDEFEAATTVVMKMSAAA